MMVKRAAIDILLLFVGVTFGFSQIMENKIDDVRSSIITKPFDVLHYSLNARLAMVDSGFSGSMSVRCVIIQPTDTLWFHSVGLVFDSVRVNGNPVSYQFYPSTERFTIYLPRFFGVGETVLVYIKYVRDLSFRRFEERQGYYFYRPSWQPGFVLENIGYTMSEPFDARLWMPCFDDPSDKATCDITVTVPQGYVAGSNGTLINVTSQDSTTTFYWHENYPLTTYLMCITASKYSTFSHYYHKIINPSDSIEVKYYCWQADSAGSRFSAVLVFEKTALMIERFSRIYGEYPFEKYGMAVAYPFGAFGMEHQTLTTMHRSIISVANYPYYEDVIAHELAHQWWGNLVTCQSFADIWLNEGFASYSEALWREKEYGRASYYQKMRNFLIFNSTWQGAIYDPQSQGFPIFGSNVYHKGAWVLHMLRGVVGDTMFFTILANYRAAYGYSMATTANFQSVVNFTTGENYDWFFNQWIYGRGWPKYTFTTSWDPSDRKYFVTVAQTQDFLWPVFRMPIEFRVHTINGNRTYVVVDSLREQTFKFEPGTQPDSLQFDPQNIILKQVVTKPGIDNIPLNLVLYKNYPNPFNPETTIEFDIPHTTRVRLDVYDVLGRLVDTIMDEVKPVGTTRVRYGGEGLASGVYFVRLQAQELSRIAKMVIVR